jgi:uncharacterized protein YndB with AHSA1/START domain
MSDSLDGTIVKDPDGYWIEFHRPVSHPPNEVWAALTDPRRLVIWEHPVEYFPKLQVGATIYAHLNYQVNAIALGKVTEVQPPRVFSFRWTTNNPMLPPEFNLRYELNNEQVLSIRSGPFAPGNGALHLLASIHIHLDHLDEAITMPEEDLPKEPWPEVSVVTRSGRFPDIARQYMEKFSHEYPELIPNTQYMRNS